MPRLNWITDEALEKAVQHLIDKAKEAQNKAENNFGKNVIDPFSALFEMSGFGLNYEQWLKTEATRQSQKTLQNHIGEFHQIILGSVVNWEDKKRGNVIDLVSTQHKILAEIKNKYNTVSGGKLADLYHSLNNLVMPKTNIYKGYTAYYVAIIPKNRNRYNKEFTPSDKEVGAKCATNPLIREIDGASFYDLITGEKNSLSNLYKILPSVIKKCLQTNKEIDHQDRLTALFESAFENI